ncbi:auxin-induced protein [Panicum miliaceum]|uniref:Auxin-induced protein n=1 Tax=Panicum miliaceum TaxID=4540 RepID=A0A3L6TK39_PANMI|nr:auxin-induced protein [Panicum miliaceum]
MVWKRKSGAGAGASGSSPGRGAGADEVERVPRGHVPMVVAGGGADGDGGGGERVLVPVRLLGDPRVAELLDMAAQRYGYRQPGVLRVPCDAGRFRRVVDGAMQRCGIAPRAATLLASTPTR